MKLLVCGGRDFTDEKSAFKILDSINPDEIVTGGARGADSIAELWARTRQIPYHVYPARWNKDGRAAGPLRNERMLKEAQPDQVLAFPGGRGTLDMIRRATGAGVTVATVAVAGV